MVEGTGAFLAWLGASLVVLSDGRRGLTVGTLIAAGGIALASFGTAGWIGAAALALGGFVAGAGRLRTGPPGWAIMPAGSTPRLVLCVAGGLIALWVGVAVMTGDDSGLRFAVMVVIGFAGARVLGNDDRSIALTATAVLALGVAAAAGLAEQNPNPATYVAAAAIAAVATWIPTGAPRAA